MRISREREHVTDPIVERLSRTDTRDEANALAVGESAYAAAERRGPRSATDCSLLPSPCWECPRCWNAPGPEWRDPEYGHRLIRVREIQNETPQRPLVLVLGTSRTQNAIHPAAMRLGDDSPRVFNFGQSGAAPLTVLLTLRRLLEDGIRPQSVLVEVLPAWLAKDGPAEVQFHETVARLSYSDVRDLTPYCDRPLALRKDWILARTASWHAQRISLMSHFLPQWLPWQSRIAFQWRSMDPDGFVPYLYSDPLPSFRAMATAQTHENYAYAFAGIRPSAVSLRALTDVVTLCREWGIAVAFFVPPTAPVFRSWFAPGVWNEAETSLRRFACDLHVEVYSAPEDFNDSNFADGHHLLRGAAQTL